MERPVVVADGDIGQQRPGRAAVVGQLDRHRIRVGRAAEVVRIPVPVLNRRFVEAREVDHWRKQRGGSAVHIDRAVGAANHAVAGDPADGSNRRMVVLGLRDGSGRIGAHPYARNRGIPDNAANPAVGDLEFTRHDHRLSDRGKHGAGSGINRKLARGVGDLKLVSRRQQARHGGKARAIGVPREQRHRRSGGAGGAPCGGHLRRCWIERLASGGRDDDIDRRAALRIDAGRRRSNDIGRQRRRDLPHKEPALDIAANHGAAREERPQIPQTVELRAVRAGIGIEERDLRRIGSADREIEDPHA